MASNEETRYIAEVASLSQIPVDIINSTIATQIAMILRDLALKKESDTFLGKIKLINPSAAEAMAAM